MKRKRILVTGARGYLGPFVCSHLREHGHLVVEFDLKSGGHNTQLSVPEPQDVLLLARGCDAIINLAAQGNVYACQENPIQAVQANVVSAIHACDAAKANGARLVHASSWEAAHPHEPYSATKLCAEQHVSWFADTLGLNACSLRLGSLYGPKMRDAAVIRKFCGLARSGKPLTIHGSGEQARQWLHVRDCAEAFRLAIESDYTGEPFYVLPDEATSIRTIAETISKRYGVGCTFGEARPADVPFARVSAERAREVLGWEARVGFDEGLAEILKEE